MEEENKNIFNSPLEELFVYDLGLPEVPKVEPIPMWKLILYHIALKAKWKSKDPLQFIKLIDFVIQEKSK